MKLCIEEMFVNGLAFFTTTSRNMLHQSSEILKRQNKEEYMRVIKM
jgi:hypothetical protein